MTELFFWRQRMAKFNSVTQQVLPPWLSVVQFFCWLHNSDALAVLDALTSEWSASHTHDQQFQI